MPEVSVSPLSESQNRLLSNEQQANNTEDHLAENFLKSGKWGTHQSTFFSQLWYEDMRFSTVLIQKNFKHKYEKLQNCLVTMH